MCFVCYSVIPKSTKKVLECKVLRLTEIAPTLLPTFATVSFQDCVCLGVAQGVPVGNSTVCYSSNLNI